MKRNRRKKAGGRDRRKNYIREKNRFTKIIEGSGKKEKKDKGGKREEKKIVKKNFFFFNGGGGGGGGELNQQPSAWKHTYLTIPPHFFRLYFYENIFCRL